MTRNFIMVALALFSWALLWAAPAAAEEPAAATNDYDAARIVVESLQDVLVSCMKEAKELGFEGRYERIYEQLDDTFDLDFAARNSIRDTWKGLTAEERAEFVDLSRRLSAARYAANFDGYDGQRFDTTEVEPAARKTLIVRTVMVQPEGRDVKFDYRMRRTKAGWRIIDVVIDGSISELALWRDQYRSVAQTGGYPKLVDTIEKKIVELRGS